MAGGGVGLVLPLRAKAENLDHVRNISKPVRNSNFFSGADESTSQQVLKTNFKKYMLVSSNASGCTVCGFVDASIRNVLQSCRAFLDEIFWLLAALYQTY
jgi:hypothetical protein